MSNKTGLLCHTCHAETDYGANWHTEDLADLVRTAAPHLQALRDLGVDEFKFYWWTDGDVFLVDFLIAHQGHDVRVYDEYGFDYDTEGKRINGQQ